MLDVGCGVGVIGLLLARDFDLQTILVEKQKMMADFARKNAEINRIEAQVLLCDFLDYESDGNFDLIVSNPPFYHDGVIKSEDPHIHACRYNSHLPPELFFAKAKRLLKPRGDLFFCYDASQVAELVGLLEGISFTVEHIRFVHPRASRPAKLVMIHARRDSRAKTVVMPPMIPFDDDGYSKEAKEIFKKARTHTIKCQID